MGAVATALIGAANMGLAMAGGYWPLAAIAVGWLALSVWHWRDAARRSERIPRRALLLTSVAGAMVFAVPVVFVWPPWWLP